MPFRLLLVRHGQTDWNAAGRIQGHTDERLNALGLWQAQRLAARLASERIDAAYASTLERTWRTAEIALAERDIRLVRDDVWREVAYGEWEGLTWEEIHAREPELAARLTKDRANVAPPGGEHFLALERRVAPAIEVLRRRHADQAVLLVTHGGPLRVLAAWCLGLGAAGAWRFQADNCTLSILRWNAPDDEGPVIELWNDTSHLRG